MTKEIPNVEKIPGYTPLVFKATFISPVLMHSDRLIDPLDGIVREIKKITSKRKKSDSDPELLAKLEWLGGLYCTEPVENVSVSGNDVSFECAGAPCIPGECIEGMLAQWGKKNRQKDVIKSGVICVSSFPLEYAGSKSIPELFKKINAFSLRASVRVMSSGRIMRVRPMFKNASFTALVHCLDGVVSKSEVQAAVEGCQMTIGLMDYRPKYGRFTAEFL